MFRYVRSIGVAVACAAAAAITVPTGTAGALNFGQVWITYRGDRVGAAEDFPVPVGTSVTLTAVPQVDVPVRFDWSIMAPWNDIEEFQQGQSVTVECKQEGRIAIEVTQVEESGQGEDYETASIVCTRSDITRLTPGAPKATKRKVIPVGTTLTFESNALSPDVPNQWRSTGISGAIDGRRFTRTFDRVGNYGVEVAAMTAAGPVKTWVGYTVIAPPTVAVVPAQTDLPIIVPVGTTITFDGSGSRSPGGGVLKYQWRTSGVRGVAGDAVKFKRRFDKAGNIGVELIVVNELGQRAKQRVVVQVVK